MWLRTCVMMCLALVCGGPGEPKPRLKVRAYEGRYTAATEYLDMAVKNTAWISTSSTDWDVAGNWSNGIPDDDDNVIISRAATADLLTNLDRTRDPGGVGNGLNLSSLRIEEGCTVNVGGSGNYLQCLISYDSQQSKLVHLGSGSVYFEQDSFGTDLDLPIVYLDSPNTANALFLKCGGATRNITNVIALNGFLSIASESLVETLVTENSDRYPGGRGPVVEIATASSGMEEIFCHTGLVTVADRQISLVNMYGGELTFNGDTTRPLAIYQTGGYMIYKGSGILPLVVGYGGILDLQQDYIDKTISRYIHGPGYELETDLNRTTITQDIPMTDTDRAL